MRSSVTADSIEECRIINADRGQRHTGQTGYFRMHRILRGYKGHTRHAAQKPLRRASYPSVPLGGP